MNLDVLWAGVDEKGFNQKQSQRIDLDMTFIREALYDAGTFAEISVFEEIELDQVEMLFEEVYYFLCMENGDDASHGRENSHTTLYFIKSTIGHATDIRSSKYAGSQSKRGLL